MNYDIELKIERKYLDKIVSGEKVEDYRSIKPFYFQKFCVKRTEGEHKGEYFVSTVEDYKPIKIIKFMAGYAKDSAFAIVEIEKIRINTFVNFIPPQFKKGHTCFTIFINKVLETGNL